MLVVLVFMEVALSTVSVPFPYLRVCVCASEGLYQCMESSVYQANYFTSLMATYLSTSPIYRWPSDGQSQGSTAGGVGKKEK